MALAPGTRIGVYEIISLLGEGGMGQVYRATDTNLKRQVALKVLPVSFATDPDRLARFQREAEVLALLNHSHIAAIYGLEKSTDVTALVMELVEGEDLSARIARGPMPLDEALPIARQIAEALEAAHEQGIIHRDLKPANIKVRPDGAVKVLDFGLAKAIDTAGQAGGAGGTAEGQPGSPASPALPALTSPTLTSPAAMTAVGLISGTAAYMAPEQARGGAVDKRADLWALGVVLWEMLTGSRLFVGETVSDTIAAVLKTDPDWSALPPSTPAAIRRLLRRCLEKDRKRRLTDAGAARLEIDEAMMAPSSSVEPPVHSGFAARPARFAFVLAAIATVVAIALAIPAVRHLRERPSSVEPIQFTILPPENTRFGGPESGGTGLTTQVAISPDGRQIVFVAMLEGVYQLWARPMGAHAAHPLAGTEGGAFPFWSPDSRFVGYFADGQLKRVPIAGGPSVALCAAPNGRGGSWNRDGVILFGGIGGSQGAPLQRVSASGGTPEPAATLDVAYGETSHRWPHFLPDGRHFLYDAVVGVCCPAPKPARVRVGVLDAPDATTLFEAESSVAYTSGYLLFNRVDARNVGRLMAQPFDPGTREFTGDAMLVAEGIGWEGGRYASFSVSDTGALVHAVALDNGNRQLTWLDRDGGTVGTFGKVSTYVNPDLSPNGRDVVVQVVQVGVGAPDIFVLGPNDKEQRLTFDPGGSASPIWSPDGLQISFQGNRQGASTLRTRPASGAGEETELVAGASVTPTDWSANGRFIAFNRFSSGGGADVWVFPLGDRTPFPFVQTADGEAWASFSPDGRWLAYASVDRSARNSVYARPFPPVSGGLSQISPDGGVYPRWRRDGKELFFVSLDGTMMAVDVVDTSGENLKLGVPRGLFKRPSLLSARGRPYDVSSDGKQFLVNLPVEGSASAPIIVVVNWAATLEH